LRGQSHGGPACCHLTYRRQPHAQPDANPDRLTHGHRNRDLDANCAHVVDAGSVCHADPYSVADVVAICQGDANAHTRAAGTCDHADSDHHTDSDHHAHTDADLDPDTYVQPYTSAHGDCFR
jgi:hypothetical protein